MTDDTTEDQDLDLDQEPGHDPAKGERIAKRLARAGLCSRRDAERWIAEGRVSVDGVKLTSPAVVVTEGSMIIVDGKPLPESEKTRLWRYHKPAGLVTSHSDEKGRQTVFDRLPADMPRVISIGRLDLSSEGLLLMTNDGELARKLELPSTGWVRRYRVRVHGTPNGEELHALEKGITVDGVAYGPIKAMLDRQQGSNAWLTVGLKEGKNREIRKVMEHLGWTVSRLIRIAYGPFQLGLLEPGKAEEVPPRVLKEQLGGKPEKEKLAPKALRDTPEGKAPVPDRVSRSIHTRDRADTKQDPTKREPRDEPKRPPRDDPKRPPRDDKDGKRGDAPPRPSRDHRSEAKREEPASAKREEPAPARRERPAAAKREDSAPARRERPAASKREDSAPVKREDSKPANREKPASAKPQGRERYADKAQGKKPNADRRRTP